MTAEAAAPLHTGSRKRSFFFPRPKYLTSTSRESHSEESMAFDGPYEGFYVRIGVISGHSDLLALSGGLLWPTGPAPSGRLAPVPVAAGPALEET